jgi:tetratricopeptide (TPR) repeat protein
VTRERVKSGDTIEAARADLAAFPDSANSYYNLGLALMHSIQPALRAGTIDAAGTKVAQEAEQHLRTALKMAANHGRAHIMLGNMCRFTNRLSEALPHFEYALGLPPDSDDWLRACDGLASSQMMLNDAPAAIKTLRVGVQNHPKQAILYFKLGVCLADQRDAAGARAALETALALQPDYPEARAALQQLAPPPPAAPVPAGAIDYVAAAKETERLGKELTETVMALMTGPGTPEEKQAKTAKLQEEFQRKVKSLYGAP